MKSLRIPAPALSLLLLLGAVPAPAQSVVQLPANIADTSARVVNVLNQDPRAGQNNRALSYSEGPVVDTGGNLYFSELGSGSATQIIWKVTPAGTATAFFTPSNNSNGLEFDNQGRLVAVQNARVMRFRPDGGRDTLIRNGGGLLLGSLNDVSIASSGHMVMTNHSGNKVFLLDSSGQLLDSVTVTGSPNGIEWIQETNTIYLAQNAGNRISKITWSPAMSSTSFRQAVAARTSFVTPTGPDGFVFDTLGNMYVASNPIGTIVVYNPAGDSIGRITVRARASGNVSNLAFGGPGNKTLFITGNVGAYKIQLKVPGRVRPGALRPAALRSRLESPDAKAAEHVFHPRRAPLSLVLPEAPGAYSVIVQDLRGRTLWKTHAGPSARVEWHGGGRNGRPAPAGAYVLKVMRDGKITASRRVRLVR